MEPDSPPASESSLKHKADALSSAAAKLAGRSRGIPSDRDFHFYNNFAEFKAPLSEIIANSEASLRSVAASPLLWGSKKPPPFPDDLDEAFDWLVNLNDDFLERFGVSMDEFKSLREKEEESGVKIGGEDESGFQLVYGKKKRASMRENEKDEDFLSSNSSQGVKVAMRDKMTTTAARSKVPFHIPTIPRPQDEYHILVNNKNQPFEHVWLEKSEDGGQFIHPLEKLAVLDFVDRNIREVEPVKPLPLESTPFKLVEEVKALKDLASNLRGVSEFAVDLEHNHYRSFQGLTCLMQVSTRNEDFIIDTLKLRIHVGPYLREIFKDPSKRKVMHGADRDILWLQRDFGIYVCNMFDTGQASRLLQLERNSLEYLLHHFCGVNANKEYQNADWRLRPLPDEMIKYAREDTHYLLHIYDLMKIRLLSSSTNESDLLLEVYKRSNEICLQLYEKELLTDTSYLYIYGLQEAEFSAKQLAIVAGLCQWRDSVARAEDESTGYILPNKTLLEIARQMPLSSGKLLRLVRSKHPFVERYLSSVIGIIRSSIVNSAAFESIAEQLKKGRLEQSAPESKEAQGDVGGGANKSSTMQKAETASAPTTSTDRACPGDSELITSQQGEEKMKTISPSETGRSLMLSDHPVAMDVENVGNGNPLPTRKATVASVQILKKPTAFGSLLGNSSSGRKPDSSRGAANKHDESKNKVEKIKSSVILPFHYFSGTDNKLSDASRSEMNGPHQENLQQGNKDSTDSVNMEEVIPLDNETNNSGSSMGSPTTDDAAKHRPWFPPIQENSGNEGLQEETDSVEKPVSPSELASSFEKCFQLMKQRRSSQQNLSTSQEAQVTFQLKPFDYAAARKNIKFGNIGEYDGAKGDDDDDGVKASRDSAGDKRKGAPVGRGRGEEKGKSSQQPRRRQAFPLSGNRSTTYH
ncbi:protein RRP6-like 2 [Ananas comosus]|uniref:Protein RRP6-like 2 n=1 Tax=Ananas comosus TaxID=4615 RepID=A0A6P5GBL0_ANACO|nr:protein RRP6-like 2 [Ananas comosus]